MGAARRYKKYPRVAMDNNWEGKVEVRMVIGANGMIASISVRSGTGHEILDQQALDMIRKAKPLAPIPAALRGKEFTVDLPVIFSLKDEAGLSYGAGVCGWKATTWSTSSRIPICSPSAWLWWLGTMASTFRPLTRRSV